ncbi:hypothetical protein LQF12_03390 [Ruania suaedae]|uniref:hypothetical protein n=1 Tax=Ruania suaedae TaxID=2897774 RepID=UPI001E4C2A7C|nr:hypothetical protein LQF12_03390 [Ruania suaedae]
MGSEAYEAEHGSFGLATLRKQHLRLRRDGVAVFDYPAKSGQHRHLELDAEELLAPLALLRRRRSGGDRLLAHRTGQGWEPLGTTTIASYLKDRLGTDASAKDFRTWHATVLAAVTLAAAGPAEDEATIRDHLTRTIADVADHLGNTPAVSRSAYIDPRVLEAYRSEGALELPAPDSEPDEVSERAVRTLLRES